MGKSAWNPGFDQQIHDSPVDFPTNPVMQSAIQIAHRLRNGAAVISPGASDISSAGDISDIPKKPCKTQS